MMEIKLSEIQITPVKPHNGLQAFVTFVLNESFFVGNVALYSRLNGEGYRLVWPIKVLHNGLKINCVHPINKQASQVIEDAVISEYQKLIQKMQHKETKGGVSNEEKEVGKI